MNIDTYGTGVLADEQLAAVVRQIFDLTPAGILNSLKLRYPDSWKYRQTASNGHFGRDIFPWEKTDRVDELKNTAKQMFGAELN